MLFVHGILDNNEDCIVYDSDDFTLERMRIRDVIAFCDKSKERENFYYKENVLYGFYLSKDGDIRNHWQGESGLDWFFQTGFEVNNEAYIFVRILNKCYITNNPMLVSDKFLDEKRALLYISSGKNFIELELKDSALSDKNIKRLESLPSFKPYVLKLLESLKREEYYPYLVNCLSMSYKRIILLNGGI